MKHTFIEIATSSLFSPIACIKILVVPFAACVNDLTKKKGRAKLGSCEMLREETFFEIFSTRV